MRAGTYCKDATGVNSSFVAPETTNVIQFPDHRLERLRLYADDLGAQQISIEVEIIALGEITEPAEVEWHVSDIRQRLDAIYAARLKAEGRSAFFGLPGLTPPVFQKRAKLKKPDSIFTAGTAASKFLMEFFRHTTSPICIMSFAQDKSEEKRYPAKIIYARNPKVIDKFAKQWDVPGRAVYFCVSTIQLGKRRSKDNTAELTGLHADLDLSNIKEGRDDPQRVIDNLPLKPRWVNFSGNGMHLYFAFPKTLSATKENRKRVEAALKRLADVLAGDTAVCEVARPMRVPGTHNSKHGGWVECVTVADNKDAYHTIEELETWLDGAEPLLHRRKPQEQAKVRVNGGSDAREAHARSNSGESKYSKLNSHAIENYDKWVPEIFPGAEKTGDGYRVSSAELGRDDKFSEDLAFHSEGIKDFGLHDGLDKNERPVTLDPLGGKRSPIDIVMEWHLKVPIEKIADAKINKQHLPKFDKAVDWLCKQLDYELEDDEEEDDDDDDDDSIEAENLFDPWAQFIVPDFPLDVLPAAVQEYVVAQAVVIGCDVSTMAMAVMCAISGALDHRFNLKMMRNGTWYASPRLWVLLYGDSSKKKTPAIDAATQPLEEHQKEVWKKYEEERRIAAESEDKQKIDPPARFVVYDTTIEKLGEMLARSGSGLLVKRDEFAGWIGSMEKYGGSSRGAGANRAFWLKAYDGGAYMVDRIQRGETFVENLSISLIGGTQPKRLSELHGLTSDGLLQRFIPVVMGASALALDKPCDTQAYASLVKQLLGAFPDFLKLSDAALQVMNDLRLHLHNIEQHSSGLAEGFQSFVGKLAGVAGSLALILHMVADPKNGSRKEVGQKTVEGVHRLIVDFILPHALEFYRTAESSTDGDRLKKIASWILTNGQLRFVISDLTSNIADFRGLTPYEVNERVSPLEAAGWIKPVSRRDGVNRAWKVNPGVLTRFAARVKDEEKRKTALAGLMGVSRRKR